MPGTEVTLLRNGLGDVGIFRATQANDFSVRVLADEQARQCRELLDRVALGV